jgi:hypothetical protein
MHCSEQTGLLEKVFILAQCGLRAFAMVFFRTAKALKLEGFLRESVLTPSWPGPETSDVGRGKSTLKVTCPANQPSLLFKAQLPFLQEATKGH